MHPLVHDDASAKASRAFHSTPTVPGRDFRCGSLLSRSVDGLLETPQLPATPRPYGNGLSVLAQSEIKHLTYATSCRTSGLQTVSDGLANNVAFEPTIRANIWGCEPTLAANES